MAGSLLVGWDCVMVNCFLLVMACVQLDLFSGQVIAPAHIVDAAPAGGSDSQLSSGLDFSNPDEGEMLSAARRAGIPLEWLGYCKDCDLLAVCSSDDCAKKGYAIDVNNPKKYGWRSKW